MLTILTPTYNRAEYLNRIYECLKNQTTNDFEWVVIDDGSTDNTADILRDLKERTDRNFVMNYYVKKNGGKHTAINYSFPYLNGEITLILDSDDVLTGDAAESVLEVWDRYKSDATLCGMSFLRGKTIDSGFADFSGSEFISDHIDFRINKNVKGDCCEVVRTDVLKEYPFPVFEGERFLGENVLWVGMAQKYKTVYVGKVIYICDYLEGGLTKSGRKLRMNNPLGGMTSAKTELDCKRIRLKIRIKDAILYSCYGFKAGYKIRKILKTSGHRFLVFMFLPFGCFFYKLWSK